MSAIPAVPVDYAAAARRHYQDAQLLLGAGKHANAGQLYGFVAECGLKAVLVISGVRRDADGSVPDPKTFRQHMPQLSSRISTLGHLIPDGRLAQTYFARMPSISHFHDWSVDHRYWRDSALPSASVVAWAAAAKEVGEMLDQAKQDGVL